ncbi:MAG: bifunctional [glutamine synthetase] adenylyltransferase/[glutamine synthetase]-adenylyl-L-tyrosine phosphorylase, partial [Devosiaceae bacterium]|nr:bifunctional [glutamine synthetase] adenylyltransferase/[glutamine synthetase]-adenylyl-L-tyrosine phosphorylase [Devosiaceae bacterium]
GAIALSNLADTCLGAALEFLVRDATVRQKFKQKSPPVSAQNCGLCVFALGKHGGRELNYSSDIDIVVFFDLGTDVLCAPQDASKTYSRIVQKLAALMQERTEYGYVFRTDLRLRPDPGSTPVALSVDAALSYYESRGQNWERAAWIKARVATGDQAVAAAFLAELAPFIWRKHLDFATIADIQAMKRQINIAQNVGKERLAGHNVKLGRGGIREIEFFAQTQQLIAGGREANLRVIPTTDALDELANNNWISHKTATEMGAAYWFLRAVENRVQMINDQQTHTLPQDTETLNAIACLMGFATLDAFETEYRAALGTVSTNYTNLFVDKNALSTQSGSLVFTGTDDDPATLETLCDLGFSSPQLASSTIRKWQYGGYVATRAAAARAHLTELIPTLLQTIAKAGNADKALKRFDDFLSRLPAGLQLFAMLRSQEQLCHLLVAFMASAPKMAEAVIRRAHVLDGLIDPARTAEIVDPVTLRTKVDGFLVEARSFEEVIDRARIVGQEQKFLISAGLISGSITPNLAAIQFANLAQTLLDRLFEHVRELFEKRHGKVAGAKVALLAFGKLGSEQMNVSSDIDVILLYDVPGDVVHSVGGKPLATSLYFTRLTQRLIAALSAQTAQGVLYELDMRLRPSGNAGPLATSLSAFTKYQMEKAWTWEHQALTRARVVFADNGFETKINDNIARVLAAARDNKQIIADVVDMRARLLHERPARHDFDFKLVEGGLIDLEFIAQSGVLLHGNIPMPLRRDTAGILRFLSKENQLKGGEKLADIYELMSAMVQITSACLVNPFLDENWTDAFKALLSRLTNYPDFARLENEVAQMKKIVIKASKNWFAENG